MEKYLHLDLREPVPGNDGCQDQYQSSDHVYKAPLFRQVYHSATVAMSILNKRLLIPPTPSLGSYEPGYLYVKIRKSRLRYARCNT